MEPHDSRDLDGAIDDVARAMTTSVLARDLRPAIAARVAARRRSWPIGWRVATMGAAMAAVAVAVAVVSRPGFEPQAAPPGAEARGVPPVVAGAPPPSTVTPRTARPDRVARQTIDRAAAAAEDVAITRVAIVPLADDGAGLEEMEPTRVVEIAPIDVEPVRISELGELVE